MLVTIAIILLILWALGALLGRSVERNQEVRCR